MLSLVKTSSPAVARKPRPITISEEGRRELGRLVRTPSIAAGLSRRARAVLLMSQGVSGGGSPLRLHDRAGESHPAPCRRGRNRWDLRAPAFWPAGAHH